MAGPTLTAPTNTDTDVTNPVVFSWEAVSGATKYQLQVATENTFASPVHDDATLVTNTDTVSLDANTEHFWRVRSDVI